ncbi:hypothetical protein SLA2020_508520 [Shorea laevis]
MGQKEKAKRRLSKEPSKQEIRRVGEKANGLSPAQSVTSLTRPNKMEKSRKYDIEHEVIEEEDINPFWKGFESEEGRLKEWMGRRTDSNRKRKKKKIRSCRSLYSNSEAIDVEIQRGNS